MRVLGVVSCAEHRCKSFPAEALQAGCKRVLGVLGFQALGFRGLIRGFGVKGNSGMIGVQERILRTSPLSLTRPCY